MQKLPELVIGEPDSRAVPAVLNNTPAASSEPDRPCHTSTATLGRCVVLKPYRRTNRCGLSRKPVNCARTMG